MVFAPLLRDPGLRGPGKGPDMGFFKTKQNKANHRGDWAGPSLRSTVLKLSDAEVLNFGYTLG